MRAAYAVYSTGKLLHVLSIIVWVGGMAFAHLCLRPAAQSLPVEVAEKVKGVPGVSDTESLVGQDFATFAPDQLDEVFRLVAERMSAGGSFCFTVEDAQESELELRPSLRYAHSEAGIRRLAPFEPACALFLTGPGDERETLLVWVKEGAERAKFEPQIRPVIDKRCLACHDGSNPNLPNLNGYDNDWYYGIRIPYAGAATVSFDFLVDSEAGFDFLSVESDSACASFDRVNYATAPQNNAQFYRKLNIQFSGLNNVSGTASVVNQALTNYGGGTSCCWFTHTRLDF